MKNIAVLLLVLFASSFTPIEKSTTDVIAYNAREIKAKFVGKSAKSFYFKKIEGDKMMEFTIVNMSILSKYDFEDKANVGKTFTLIYEVQKLETLTKDPKKDGAKVSQYIERKILMEVELIE